MKNVSTALRNALMTGDVVKAVPVVTIDWNLNRYHDTRVANTPDEEDAAYQNELFPIESIVEPNRPSKGINKARVGHSTVSKEYFDAPGVQNSKFYIADEEDVYKYWTSPLPAVGGAFPLFNSTNFPVEEYPSISGYDNLTSVKPKVEYGTWTETVDEDTGEAENDAFTAGTVDANKIVVKVENTWATPNDFDIVIVRNSSTTTITNEQLTPGWEATGEIVLRWSGTQWAHTPTFISHPTTDFPGADTIKSVQVVVRTMREGYQKTNDGSLVVTQWYDPETDTWRDTNGSDSYFDLIEIAAHLEANVTPWVLTVNDSFDMGEVSHLYPLGTITSNSASITLSNLYERNGEQYTGLFSQSNDDPTVPWSDYLEPNAEVNCEYVYYDEDEEEIGRVQQFVMYAETWTGQSGEEVTLDLLDYSKFLNQQTVPRVMWEDLKVPEIVWRVCDSIGFNNYKIDRGSDRVTEHHIPVFWTEPDQTVWEVLDELARASQSAIYIDNNGVLQIKTRDFAFSEADEPVWTFLADDEAEQVADIMSLAQDTVFEPNSIKVVYQKTNWSKWNRGQPTMQTVWEPEDENVVLRAAPLVRDLGLSSNYMYISADDAKVWHYEGMVNIEGELIKYNGKVYRYYTGAGEEDYTDVVIKSDDERRDVQRNKTAFGYRHKSFFTGGLSIKKRGVWNTETKEHYVDLQADAKKYSVRQIVGGTHKADVGGFVHLRKESKARLNTGKRHKDYRDLLIATQGAPTDEPFYYYGTRLMFSKEKSQTTQTAGMVIHNSTNNEDGYYIELKPSANVATNDAELKLVSRVNGKNKVMSSSRVSIGVDIDYEVDVTYIDVEGSGAHRIQVSINGVKHLNREISGADRNTPGGRFGLFAKGKTKVDFEFLYAIRRKGAELPDDFSFLDKMKRGFSGQQWDREWVFEWRQVKKRKKKNTRREKYRFNRQFYDEFGPIAHEVREYEVSFEPTPVLHSRLYSTNDWSSVALEYRADPFGARFYVANTSRQNAVIHGEDNLSYAGASQAVNHMMVVLGRPLVIEEAEEYLVENTDQVRARGRSETELTSPWIQSKGMAKDLAHWIRKNFTYGNEGVVIEVFGNPLVEVGDVVRVEYPDRHIFGEYFVVGVSNNFEAGISTTVTLRERVS